MVLAQAIVEFPALPKAIKHADILREKLLERLDDHPDSAQLFAYLNSDDKASRLIAGIAHYSPFLTTLICEAPAECLATLMAPPDDRLTAIRANFLLRAEKTTSDDELAPILRHYRRDIALLAALADISGQWSLEAVTGALSTCAQDAVNVSVRHLFRDAAEQGLIISQDADPAANSGYFVLGMGKLGGHELNYSSDIDLIVFFDPAKAPVKAGREPGPLYMRLTQRLVRLLQERTADGYVFRTDLRLRPDPGSTAIAISVPSALHYYESIGQTWERSAMIKARVIAGDASAGNAFLAEMVPFIWRKYFDYAAVSDIHAMKRQIHAFRGHDAIAVAGHNVKLGRGGIREIEFFVQTQQLIAAGRNPLLRVPQTLPGLDRLVEAKWVTPETRDRLADAYRYLRRIEHRLQMVADEQTHSLPEDAAELQRFAAFAGYADVPSFERDLLHHLRHVEAAYARLFEEAPPRAEIEGLADYRSTPPRPGTLQALASLGFENPGRALEIIQAWQEARTGGLRSTQAREQLHELVPVLLDAFARSGDGDRGLIGFDRLITKSSQPLELITLLRSHPDLLDLICMIFSAAPRLTEIVSRRVHVLDALVDPSFFGAVADQDALAAALEQSLMAARDYEDLLDRVRIFGQEQMFLVGVRILSGTLTAAAAGEAFARLADVIVGALFAAVERNIIRNYGRFPGMRIAVVAMGKLGSREMTSSSDLDLMVLYDHDDDAVMSDGDRPLAASQYFARFTQRLIAALSAPTSEGILYEVDMRLRPSGRSGPIATRLGSFSDYQRDEAWTWEHMALTRARVIAATPGFADTVRATIAETIARERDVRRAIGDVREMREAIAIEKGEDDPWDIKCAAGGLIDLEFIAQTLQLIKGREAPTLLHTNTARVIEAASALSLLEVDDGSALLRACQLEQALTQILRLCLSETLDEASRSPGLQRLLARAGEMPDFRTLDADLRNTQKEVRRIFKALMKRLAQPSDQAATAT